MDFKSLNEKMENIEIEYIKKLEQAKQENNYDKIMVLFFELKFLRNQNKKKCKYIEKRDANKLISREAPPREQTKPENKMSILNIH